MSAAVSTPVTYATLVALCVNVFCAYGLIFGEFGLPAWGVYGAGMAIVISQTVYMSILLVRLLSRRQRATYATGPVRVDFRAIRRFLRTSGAIGGQWLLDSTSFALFTSIVARMGDAEMAASQAMLQLLSLSYMQAIAISVATGTLVGRYIGAGDLTAASRSYASAMKLAMLLAITGATLFLTIPELLMQIFTRDAGVIELAGPLLLLGAFFQFVDAVLIITNGSLRGGGGCCASPWSTCSESSSRAVCSAPGSESSASSWCSRPHWSSGSARATGGPCGSESSGCRPSVDWPDPQRRPSVGPSSKPSQARLSSSQGAASTTHFSPSSMVSRLSLV